MTGEKQRSVWRAIRHRRLLITGAALLLLAVFFATSASDKTYKRHTDYGAACEDVHARTGALANCVTLYFATTRQPKLLRKSGGGDTFATVAGFGNTFDNRLHFGRAEVSLPYLVSDLYPDGRKRGVVDHASDGPPDGRAATERYVAITTITKATMRETFAANLREAVGRNNDGVLLFIHGFNVNFDAAVVRTAQMAADLGFNENAPPGETYYGFGQPVLFSWPNGGVPFSYVDDRRLAKKSATHLKEFLDLLTRDTGARTLNVIVHSMGNRVFVNAIADFSRDYAAAGGDVTIRIIHAAADVDQGVFDKTMDDVERTNFRAGYTVYASKADSALETSTRVNALTSLFRDRSGRLGEIGETGIYVRGGVTSIDATGFATDLFGHGYFSNAGNVINDIACVFHGVDPERRALVPRRKSEAPYFEMDSSKYAPCLPGELKRFADDAAQYAEAHADAVRRAETAGVFASMSDQLSSLAGKSIFDPDCLKGVCGAHAPVEPGSEEDGDPMPPAPAPDNDNNDEPRDDPPETIETTVYFDFDLADLTASAARDIDALVSTAAGRNIAQFVVIGHADRAGGETFNQKLSLLRADAVRAHLAARGIDENRIFIRGMGETELARATADGEREPLNRRARLVIIFD